LASQDSSRFRSEDFLQPGLSVFMTTADHGEGFCKQQVWYLKTAAGPAEDFVQAAVNWQVS
jgi:hypothetical protein